jgi:hypothetical protein
MSVLYSRLCSDEAPFERRAMRAALDIHARAPVLPAFADVALQPAGFLSQHLPPALDALVPPGYMRQVSLRLFTALSLIIARTCLSLLCSRQATSCPCCNATYPLVPFLTRMRQV